MGLTLKSFVYFAACIIYVYVCKNYIPVVGVVVGAAVVAGVVVAEPAAPGKPSPGIIPEIVKMVTCTLTFL